MKYDYKTLKSLPLDIPFGLIIDFLARTKNSRFGPLEKDSSEPPVFFWWFEENDATINKFILDAVESFNWDSTFMLQDCGNGKWLLFPKKTYEVQTKIYNNTSNEFALSRKSSIWLMKNDPDFGRRANKDLERFRVYFRSAVENYLKEKEGIK